MQNIVNRLKSINRWALVGVGVVVVLVAGYFALNASKPAQPVQAMPQTVRVTKGDLAGTITTSGQLTPKRDASLAVSIPGIVKEVDVAQGDKVKAGDVLIKLDDSSASNNVNKANLALEMAQVRLDSAQHDYNHKVTWTPNGNQLNAAEAVLSNSQAAVNAAQSDYDKVAFLPWVSSTPQSLALAQATNNYTKAKADLAYLYSNSPDTILARDNLQTAQLGLSSAQVDLQMAKDTLSKMTLTAPFDGTITSVNVEVGESASGPVVEMATMDHLEVILDVDEVDVGALKVGQAASVTFDAWPGQKVTGKVITIAPKANATANVVNFEVHIGLDPTELDLRAGMTADATIQTFQVKGALLLPRDAVEQDTQTGKAYVNLVTLQNGVRRTEVRLGQHNDQYVQILGGLQENDEVLANPGAPLQ